MSIRLILVYLSIISSRTIALCPSSISTTVLLTGCVFDTSVYKSLGGTINNYNSISYTGYYSLNQLNRTDLHVVRNSMIYNLGHRWMLSVPLMVKCNEQVIPFKFTECQYTIKRSTNRISSTPEYMTTHLSILNINHLGFQPVLFLQPGEITLHSCKAYDCRESRLYLTSSNETFNFKIDYEKLVGSSCHTDDDCHEISSKSPLLRCDSTSQTCQCQDETMSKVDLHGAGRLCVDSIVQSNCTKFPNRCLTWCESSPTTHCLCPKLTRKVRKITGLFDCELEPNSPCRFHDQNIVPENVRKCPTGTTCDGRQCRSTSLIRHTNDEPTTSENVEAFPTSTIGKILQENSERSNLVQTLIFIVIAIFLLFILIILIATILITSDRCRFSFKSSEKEYPSSNFISANDKPTTTTLSTIESMNSNLLGQGLLPLTNLSPRFYRQNLDEHRRIPLNIRSPSLASINPIIDNRTMSLKRTTSPRAVTHFNNGELVISV